MPKPVALAPKRRQQASIDERGLAAAGSAHHHHERVVAEFLHQLTDRTLELGWTPSAKEECGILFPESVEPTVGADGFPYSVPRRWRAADGRQQARKFVWRIRHLCDVREIDPGKEVQKVERPIGCGFRQDHWHDREGRIAALADNRKLTFVLLSV